MIPLHQFQRALLDPQHSLVTLSDATVRCDANALPIVQRTTRYAECEIEWHGVRYLLMLPCSRAVMHRSERLIAHLNRCHHPAVAPLQLLHKELHIDGDNTYADLVLQQLLGSPLKEVFPLLTAEELDRAIEQLKSDLNELGITHRNLKAENLRWVNGRLVPIRYLDAVEEHIPEEDSKALAALYNELTEPSRAASHDQRRHAAPFEPLIGHQWVGNEFEGLICVEDGTGIGFVDAANRVVIPATYRWADDFHEGRAVVETAGGMGVIDCEGNYILPPIYELVEYRHTTSRYDVRQEGLWARFNHLGKQLTPFGITRES